LAYSVSEPAVVSKNRCERYDHETVSRAIGKALEDIGGIEDLIGPGGRVLLKPNLLSAKAPQRAVTTHPMIVQAVAEKVRSLGAVPFIGDSPGGVLRGVRRVWENTGMADMAAKAGIEMVNFEASGSKEIRSGRYLFHIAKPVLEADAVINIGKLKTHTLTLFTCAVKNMFGSVPGFRKSELHKEYPKPGEFSRMLVALYGIVRPDINIVDAVLAMEGNGPSSGNPKKLGVILAGKDAVAVDAVAADMIGFKKGAVQTTRIAGERGLGVSDLESIRVTGDAAGFKAEGFVLTSNWKLRMIPGVLARLVSPLVWLRPEIDEDACVGCRLCEKSCPVKAISFDGKVCVIDSNDCVNCMCCHELCPENAVEIIMSRLARFIS